MADISAEIAAFKNAVYGEDVRDAMVSLANKLNNVVTGVIADGGTLTSDNDLNTLSGSSYYRYGSGSIPQHAPSINDGGILLHIDRNTIKSQWFIGLTGSYERLLANNTWYDWRPIEQNGIVITGSTNLNDLKPNYTTMYYAANASSIINKLTC